MYSEYAERDAILSDMGFTSYSDYLKSQLWFNIRRRTIKRDKKKCYVCQCEATAVHHKSYSKLVLLGKDLNELISICSTCHELCEYGSNGWKLHLEDANKQLERIKKKLVDKERKPLARSTKHKKKNRVWKCIICNGIARKGKQFCRPCQKARKK